jgi:hypothetical protein
MRNLLVGIPAIAIGALSTFAMSFGAGLTGDDMPRLGMLLMAFLTVFAAFVRLADRTDYLRVKSLLEMAAIATAVVALLFGGARLGLRSWMNRQRGGLPQYENIVHKIDPGSLGPNETRLSIDAADIGCYVYGTRAASGQVVIRFNSRSARRGMVYVSTDDIRAAAYPAAYALYALHAAV